MRRRFRYTLKVDLDLKVKKKWLKLWEKSRKQLLEGIDFYVKKIVIKESSKRGYHSWIHVESSKKLKPADINMLQWLCGDDTGRVLINSYRIKRKIKNWNKIFSRVLWRKKHECNCSIHQKILRRVKEGQKFIMGV